MASQDPTPIAEHEPFPADSTVSASEGSRPDHIKGIARRGGMAKLTPTLRALALASQTAYAVAPQLTTRYVMRHFMRPRRKPGYDYRAQLPTGAERLQLPYRGLKLTGWRWGDGGPSLLLVHGWEDHSGSMLGFVEPLLGLGYRVYAFDALGHGLSPRVPTHLLDFSLAVEAIKRAHGPFESVVAHSFGAAATCLSLARAPELRPQKMTLISPMQGIDQHLDVFRDIALLSSERAERLRRMLADQLGMPTEQICALRAIRDLDIPGLVIHDRHDRVIPHDGGERFAREWRGARFISTQRLGHRRVLRCPNVLEEVLSHHRPA
ncbi:MAG: alpha/beta fold hydrolase [Halieaceae bacterium]|jgi:pimeloyl-ACP methyl ester carboxylesterase|nr:alpha/beta fold hydrolase [Halieaceae bacterium]